MVIEAKKKDNESNESLIRRFTNKLRGSGVLIQAKKTQFYEKPKNKSLVRKDAIRRKKTKDHYDYLRKIGKIDENEGRYGRRRRGQKGPKIPKPKL